MRSLVAALLLAQVLSAQAGPLVAPGDTRLRHDLELLNDAGVISVPLTAWPVSLSDVEATLSEPSPSVPDSVTAAYRRVLLQLDPDAGPKESTLVAVVSGAIEPRLIRSFEDTPRDEGEISAALDWSNERLFVRLSATAVANPFDGDDFRPDGTVVGASLGNWLVTAGWQDRWWGPGRDGSLILSNNSRPAPGVGLQRNVSRPFESRWLSWLGPWTFTTFMSQLDDDRVIDDAWLFGVRGSFRPPGTGLEVGISRTAQWCGNDRPCDLGVFADLLVGNDNRGVNVAADEEPGNQLGGFDIRWRLPKGAPAAFYMQWIGEDGRGGGGAIGSWLRQLGVEFWGTVGEMSHRTHFEVSDTTCRQGGFGFSDAVPNCGYEHSIYTTGYRYEGRAIAHGADGDSRSYSLGSTLVQSAGHTWNLSLRYMNINRTGPQSARHTLTPTPRDLTDVQLSHARDTQLGRWRAGLGYARSEDNVTSETETDVSAFIQWSSR